MPFDVNAFRDAHRPWSFTVGARTFGARHVSAQAAQSFDRRIAGAKTTKDRERAIWWILRRAFPWRLSYALRGDPVTIILRELEAPARAEALKDFFACLRGENSEHPSKTIRGMRSHERTPPPVA
jgi:hypothetical protein